MSQPVRMWAIVDKWGRIIQSTLRHTRTEAIKAWLAHWDQPPHTWQHWRRQGDRARRVTITVENTNG